MQSNNLRKIFVLIVFMGFFLPALHAEDRRTIPLDAYLIIDGSASLEKSKADIVAWINERLVEEVLVDGDKINVWVAGDKARLIHSETLSGAAGKKAVKDKLAALDWGGKAADFSGALRDVTGAISQTAGDGSRLSYTVLITASAEALGPAVAGNAQGLLRWFRSERYERWQVLVVAPDIGSKVRQAAAVYMSSLRGGTPAP